MKKSLLVSFLVLCLLSKIAYAQPTRTVEAVTPGGVFDVVYDKDGQQYSLFNLTVNSGKAVGGPFSTINAIPMASCSSGYFNLYFETNSIWTQSVSMQTVLCKVCEDISLFILSPLTNTAINSTNFKVNLYCGNAVGVLATGSSFFVFPPAPTSTNPGVIDGQVYKAIVSGLDPYLNLPTTFTNSGNFYHGFIGVNPSPTYNWNTNLGNYGAGILRDFYSVMLHEVLHTLGIGTLINNTGYSVFGQSSNYFHRFDKFLYDYSGNPLLTSITPSCSTANLSFTGAISAIAPSVTTWTSAGIQDITTCSVAAQYSSSNVHVKVYTPDYWEPGSSLSHFEDMCSTSSFNPVNTTTCIPTPTAPGYNNQYFVMANNSFTPGQCYMARYPRTEERLVLCDLGYSVSSTYSSIGSGTAVIDGANYWHSYPGGLCSSTNIIGLNDGIQNGIYIFTTTSTSISIPTSSLLLNDIPATGLNVTCVSPVFSNATNSLTASLSGNSVIVNAIQGSGLALVQYIPANSVGTQGNVTYIFVYFLSPGCNPVNACNIVQNGGFESLIGSTACSNMTLNTGPIVSCWDVQEGLPSISSRSCTSGSNNYNLNSNTIGSYWTPINSFNGAGNDRVALLSYDPTYSLNTQAIKNNLGSPLVQSLTYKLNMLLANVVSTVSGYNNSNHPVVITIGSLPLFASIVAPPFPANVNVITEFTVPAGNTWTQVNQTFTFSSPGGLNHNALVIGINSAKTLSLTGITAPESIWCYLDEVSLLPVPGPSLSIPFNTLCINQAITNLGQYASVSGVFSGTHVVSSAGIYHFNLNSTLSPGTYPISFSYTHAGCTHTLHHLVGISSNTNVLQLNNTSICSNTFTLDLPSMITNTAHIAGTSFQVNSIPASTSTPYTFTAQGIYTITASNTNTTLNLCNSTATIAVPIFSPPSTPTLFNSSNFTNTINLVCSETFTAQALNTASNYVWTQPLVPGISYDDLETFFLNATYSPLSSTIYTFSTFNHSTCATSATLAAFVPTNCCDSPSLDSFTSTSVSGSPVLSGPVLLPNNFTVTNGANLWLMGEVIISPNVSITIASGAQLTIYGAHLYSCADMWKGIVVADGGKIIAVHNGTTGNMVEDAETAICVKNYTSNTNPILDIDNTVFNRNLVSINIDNYKTGISNAFRFDDCVFSCRNFTFSGNSWSQAGTSSPNLRFAANPTTGLAPPYDMQGATVAYLKNPHNTIHSQTAFSLTGIGITGGTTTPLSFQGIDLSPSAASSFFLFDAHVNFLKATNSNIKIANSVFQNTQTFSVNGIPKVGAAVDYSCSVVTNYIPGGNQDLYELDMGATITNTANRFYDCHKAIVGNNPFSFKLENAIIRSTHLASNATNTLNLSTGQTGVFMRTNQVEDYIIKNNEFSNVTDGVAISLYPENVMRPGFPYISGPPQYFMINAYIHTLSITGNTFSPVDFSNGYLKNAIHVSSNPDDITAAVCGCTGVYIENNECYRVLNGISLHATNPYTITCKNLGVKKIIRANRITLEEDNIFGGIVQRGIEYTSSKSEPVQNGQRLQTVEQNTITVYGNSSVQSNTNINLYYGNYNGGTGTLFPTPHILCNELSNVNKGFVFDGPNRPASWRGNKMQDMMLGMVLTNTGVIGDQGNTTNPTDNEWNGSWPTTYSTTYTDAFSDAVNSKLWVRNGSMPYYPTNNGSAIPGQSYNQSGNLNISSSGSYSCGAEGSYTVMNSPAPGTESLTNVHNYISATFAYRYLTLNDSMKNADGNLVAFYNDLSGTSIDYFMQIEMQINQRNFSEAQSILNSMNTSGFNEVETNYYDFYTLSLLFYTEPDDFSPDDLQNLASIASKCPGTEGNVIYQSRALYLQVTGRVFNSSDGCAETGARMAKFEDKAKETSQENWKIDLFPNPLENRLTIVNSTKDGTIDITITDLTGRIVKKQRLKCEGNSCVLNLDLINGSYFITICNSSNETTTKQILIYK